MKELANKRMEEIRDLSKQIGFNNLIYIYKSKTAPKYFIDFKGALSFYNSRKEGSITLEKAEEKQNEFKSDINEIIRGSKKSEEQNNTIKNIETH